MTSMKTVTRNQEVDLVRRLHRNDPSAIEELYTTYFDRLYSLVYNQVDRDRSTTEDIVQDTFLAAVRSSKRFRGQSSTYTWLCSIAYHKVADFYRRKASEARHVDRSFNVDDLESGEQQTEIAHYTNPTDSIDTAAVVQQAMAGLPWDYRQVLILKYVDELPVLEISRIMRRSPKSIEGLLSRARKALRSSLPDWGE
jgi:RNA polymerase sigma-70 factor (ECF subfamily)